MRKNSGVPDNARGLFMWPFFAVRRSYAQCPRHGDEDRLAMQAEPGSGDGGPTLQRYSPLAPLF